MKGFHDEKTASKIKLSESVKSLTSERFKKNGEFMFFVGFLSTGTFRLNC